MYKVGLGYQTEYTPVKFNGIVVGYWFLNKDEEVEYESAISGLSWNTIETNTAENLMQVKSHLIEIFKEKNNGSE